MTFEIDMDRLAEGGAVLGINLWTIRSITSGQTGNGDPKLIIKFAHGASEIQDHLALAGGGSNITREKLIALGVPPTGKFTLDPVAYIGVRVWLATFADEYVDKHGKPRVGTKVDIAQLAHNGYQAESDVPPGCSVPADVDDQPF